MITTEPDVKLTDKYSVTQTSKLLDISRQTIYRDMNSGNLKFKLSKSNNRRILSGKDIKKYWLMRI